MVPPPRRSWPVWTAAEREKTAWGIGRSSEAAKRTSTHGKMNLTAPPFVRRDEHRGWMMDVSDHGGPLRTRDSGEQRVTPLELFFDLVFVFAVTQLSHLVLVAVMLASLLMSVAIPEAFGERGLMFALAYVAIQAGRTAFAVLALYGASHPLSGTFWRILAWFVAAGVLWVAGGLVEGGARYVLWLLALAVDYAGPVMRYWTPGLGSARTEEWAIEGTHFAERCQLFIIIALGESILVTGTTFGEIEASAVTVCAFVVAFLGSVALWWIYFARSAEAAREVFTSSEDPGRLGRSAYTYFHLPMIAGIIAVAAADELTVAHPGEHGTTSSIALILGGTALFLAGHALFKWDVFGVLPWSHAVAVAALIALIPVGFAIPTLALSGSAGLIVVGLAVWDPLAYGHMRSPRRAT